MTMTKIMIIAVFIVPLSVLCMMFAAYAARMMREEEERAKIRAASRKARIYEAARRSARGTPRRIGCAVIR